MNTIKDKTSFTYNGKNTNEFGIINVSMDNGMFDETFVASRTVNSETVKDVRKSLFNGVTYEDLTFELNLAFENNFTDDLIDKVINWLYEKEYYSKLQFEELNKFVYAMPNGESRIVHTGTGRGYINVTMVTNSPYVFGDIVSVEKKANEDSVNITLDGKTNPEMNIDLYPLQDGVYSITVNGYTLQLSNLKANEVVTINPYEEDITSSLDNVYHYSDYVGDLSKLGLLKEENTISVPADKNLKVLVTYQPYYMK